MDTEVNIFMKRITTENLQHYKRYLINEEKATATIEKYTRDVTEFSTWLGEKLIEKADVLLYKSKLIEQYAPASVNASLSSLNSFFTYMGWYELRVKNLKIQKQIFSTTEKELTKAEYERLLSVAKDKKNERLYLLMQTICSTGIRVSEVKFITIASVNRGVAEINGKGKRRRVLLPAQLCKILKKYVREQQINSGAVFITKSGRPLDRSNIWSDMKRLCRAAKVPEKKVFPHNLRHLFARTYYSLQKDIVRLADILGHSNVNTTRIYTMESGEIHRRQIQKLGLLLC